MLNYLRSWKKTWDDYWYMENPNPQEIALERIVKTFIVVLSCLLGCAGIFVAVSVILSFISVLFLFMLW